MRICQKKKISTKKQTQQHAHTKSVAARLVDCENWSKKKTIYIFFFKQQHAHTKSVARLVDSKNLSKHFFTKTLTNNNMSTQKMLLDQSIVRIGLKLLLFFFNKKNNTRTQKVLLD